MLKLFQGAPPNPRGTLLVTLAAGAALVLPATSAFAHVSVNPREAVQGRYAKLAFRVPNERDNAGTTRLEVNLPAGHPFASVSVRPQPGWTYAVEKVKLATPVKVHGNEISEAATKITWTGGVIKPHEFNEFEVSVGPLPSDVDSVTFKALQPYDNGEVVRWIEEETPGRRRARVPGAGPEADEGGRGDDRYDHRRADVPGRRSGRAQVHRRRLEERCRHRPDVRHPRHGVRPARVRLGHGRPPAAEPRAFFLLAEAGFPASRGATPVPSGRRKAAVGPAGIARAGTGES